LKRREEVGRKLRKGEDKDGQGNGKEMVWANKQKKLGRKWKERKGVKGILGVPFFLSWRWQPYKVKRRRLS